MLFFKLFVTVLFVGMIIYFIYVIAANDRAVMKINFARTEINEILNKECFYLFELDYNDCARCEITYTINPDDVVGIPPRKMLKMIKGIKNGTVTFEELEFTCEKALQKHNDKLSKKQTL